MDWLEKLDWQIATVIRKRLLRLEDGNFGDYKRLDKDLYEIRIHISPGFRVYFSMQDGNLILLLIGGNKSTQKNDIEKAKQYLKEYLEDI